MEQIMDVCGLSGAAHDPPRPQESYPVPLVTHVHGPTDGQGLHGNQQVGWNV